MTTHERLRQWVAWWSADVRDDDPPPARPADVGQYHDKQLKQIAMKLATIERERGR